MANGKTLDTANAKSARSPERAKLGAKIDELNVAQKNAADAKAALATAHRNWSTACVARDKIEGAAPSEAAAGEALVASLLAGDAVGSTEIDDPRAKHRQALERARADIDAWASAENIAADLVKQREGSLVSLGSSVERMARDVVAMEADIEKLIADCECAQAVVISARIRLSAVGDILPDNSDAHRRVRSTLAAPWLLPSLNAGRDHPASIDVWRWFAVPKL